MSSAGGQVVSVDPIYEFSGSAIERRFEAVAPSIIDQVRQSLSDWVWTYHATPDDLFASRRHTLNRFLHDYHDGRLAGRYVTAALPSLPFAAGTFDLALCSHLLFLYSSHMSEEFHVRSVLELCRVAGEVRIFPLLTLAQERSPHLSAVCAAVSAQGLHSQVVRVDYEFQRGGNEMLLIQRT